MTAKKYLYITVLILGCVSQTVFALVPDTQRTALVDLYQSLSGPDWQHSANWLVGDPCANNWFGIACDENDNIIDISLPSNGLMGSLPVTIINLSELLALDLSSAYLNVEPVEIAQMTSLKELNLNQSFFWRPNPPFDFPVWTLNLTDLEHLSLSANLIYDEIPNNINLLSELKILDLSHNDLTGVLPNNLTQLTNLVELNLINVDGNHLTGTIPLQVTSLQNLEKLLISNSNSLGTIPSDIGNLTNLNSLYLDAKLTGNIPVSINQLSQLTTLYLDGDFIDTEIPPQILQLTGLESLTLSANLEGEIPVDITMLDQLKYLNLSQNKMIGGVPSFLSQLTLLEELNLSRNQLNGTISNELATLSNLNILRLDINQLTGEYPAWIHTDSPIIYAELSFNHLVGEIPFNANSYIYTQVNSRNNGLYTNEVFLDELNDQECFCDWSSTQTIAPSNITFNEIDANNVVLNWDQIEFIHYDGGYELWLNDGSGSGYVFNQKLESKAAETAILSDLLPGNTYTLKARAFTDYNDLNKTLNGTSLDSEFSNPVVINTTNNQYEKIDLSVGLSEITLGDHDEIDWYDVTVNNNSLFSLDDVGFNLYGVDDGVYLSFGIVCEETSNNTSCPVIPNEAGNKNLLLDMPADSWVRFRVYLGYEIILVMPKIDYANHVIQVIPPIGYSDINFSDNQANVFSYDLIFENTF